MKKSVETKAKHKKVEFRPKKVVDILPDKLSDLIEVALNDLIAVEKSKKYDVNMDEVWYEPVGKKCHVCFAGSVMVNSLGCNLEDEIEPDDFTLSLNSKFRALDFIRDGYVEYALNELRIDIESILNSKNPLIETLIVKDVDITHYEESPAKFKKEMAKLAKDLRELGL